MRQPPEKAPPKTSSPSLNFELPKPRFASPKTARKSRPGALSQSHIQIDLGIVAETKKILVLRHIRTLNNYCKILCFQATRHLRMRVRSSIKCLIQQHHFGFKKCAKIMKTSMSNTMNTMSLLLASKIVRKSIINRLGRSRPLQQAIRGCQVAPKRRPWSSKRMHQTLKDDPKRISKELQDSV